VALRDIGFGEIAFEKFDFRKTVFEKLVFGKIDTQKNNFGETDFGKLVLGKMIMGGDWENGFREIRFGILGGYHKKNYQSIHNLSYSYSTRSNLKAPRLKKYRMKSEKVANLRKDVLRSPVIVASDGPQSQYSTTAFI